MNIGDVVIVLGGFDERVRQKEKGELVFGTIFFLYKDQASVILQNNDIWEGDIKMVRLADEQK